MTKNTTSAGRGAMLAKEALTLRKSPPILLADMEKGNRHQRRMAVARVLAGSVEKVVGFGFFE